MSRAYYNEINPGCAAWLRQLIDAGLIANGDVDNRSIRDVRPADLRGYTQCHFFAGIGLWSLALRMVEWPDDRNVWTGSCPCQPFSLAGARQGVADDRHLWPAWFDLIRECRPSSIYGEQVASAIGHGWLDLVADGMEAEGYAVASAVLQALSVGAPHRRERLYFVANAPSIDGGTRRARGFADDSARLRNETRGDANDMGDASCAGLAKRQSKPGGLGEIFAPFTGANHWADDEWLACRDGKQRRIKPGVRLLANGRPVDVAGQLSALGNAIVPQVAAAFIVASQ